MLVPDLGLILLLVFQPYRMQAGGAIKLLQKRYRTLNVGGIRRKIGDRQHRRKVGGSAQIERQGDVLGNVMAEIARVVLRLELAKNALRHGRFLGLLDNLLDFEAYGLAQGQGVFQSVIVATAVQRDGHTKDGFAEFKLGACSSSRLARGTHAGGSEKQAKNQRLQCGLQATLQICREAPV